MPLISQWIDELRQVFGAELINGQIRRGMAGEPTFFAEENGNTIGTPFPERPTWSVAEYRKLGEYIHPADQAANGNIKRADRKK